MGLSICHVSDTHGHLAELVGDFDVVVHSGDLLPNRTRGIRAIEEPFQRRWVEKNAVKIHKWLRSRPLLLVHGNHDFIDAVPVLQSIGVEVYGLDDARAEHGGFVFAGFPHVPYFTGEWNYECGNRELVDRTNAIDLEGVDVLVAHSPIYGVLDRNAQWERCGSEPMKAMLEESAHVPEWYLHGHIHESNGLCGWKREIRVSNAATGSRVIELT